ncbi:hypothetical protein T265_03601 [Opisthorchis viverrini]|uniref:G-protein coupled receptors family 1 profile domain-containing protein n=1 Tax=Opisthorchis viverrini TaxID=6198 RepID=A0A074ZVB7_OPIVI|nr:hypothetical protein T265_03601 [Opisthorchis viverrini]KER29802.1 hypothetical protein T265_03601 [Opisthorchis viverrini]
MVNRHTHGTLMQMDQTAFLVRLLISNLGFVGTLLNTIQLYVLCQCRMSSRITTLLLRTQSVIDAYTCLIIFTSKLAGSEIDTGVPTLDEALCYLWYKDNLFWLGVVASVQNLTCISFDRFYAVCYPSQYKMRQIQLIIGCYCYEVGMTLFLFIPNFFLRRYESNQCNSQFAFDGHVIEQFFEVQAYLWTLFNYVLPAFVMISSHAYVIHVLRRPTTGQEGSQFIRSNVKRLILTTSMMAGFLLVLHLYEAVKYILGNSGIVPYASGSVLQQVGILLITLSAVLNPCVLVATSHRVRMQVSRIILNLEVIDNSISATENQTLSRGLPETQSAI